MGDAKETLRALDNNAGEEEIGDQLKITIEGKQGEGKTQLAVIIRGWLSSRGWTVSVFDDLGSEEIKTIGDPTSRKIAAIYIESK